MDAPKKTMIKYSVHKFFFQNVEPNSSGILTKCISSVSTGSNLSSAMVSRPFTKKLHCYEIAEKQKLY